MIIIGVEGPSYAGKSTLSEQLFKLFLLNGYKTILLPCYMQAIDDDIRKSISLGIPSTIQEEVETINKFIAVETERNRSLQDRLDLQVAILDRTIISLLAYNYSIDSITGKEFYKASRELILTNLKELVIPKIFIYVDTPQQILSSRYPPSDETIFTNQEFNKLFRKYYFHSKNENTIIKKSIEVTLSNDLDLRKEVEKCYKMIVH